MPIQQGRVRMLGFRVGRDNTTIRYNLGYVP